MIEMVFAKDGEFVAPGEPLCVIEEFLPGVNVKLHQDGVIASIRSGIVRYDGKKRIVSVKPRKEVAEIKVGDKVLVKVKEVQDKIAVTEIISVNGEVLKHPRVAVILPSPSMRDNMGEYVGIGDLVYALVINVFAGVIGLSIWRPGFGALLSLCDRCGGILKKKGRELICTRCGNKEKRKIVPYYGDLARIENLMR